MLQQVNHYENNNRPGAGGHHLFGGERVCGFCAIGNGGLVLEEVVATATKRESNLQDVAVAVMALGADLLQAAQIRTSLLRGCVYYLLLTVS
ncbi:MAG: hypothetical protein P8J17_02065 [Halioglobus sp.]|nr:hypothetical protein [Halioglobus sp.]